MESSESIFEVFKQNVAVEFLGVITFTFLYEIILKPIFLNLSDRFKARKSNVRGSYISYFDDLSAGNAIKQVSDLRLEQRGKKVFATDIVKDLANKTSRSWNLEGTLLHGHMIAGIYREISHRDSRSVGSFFVAQQENSVDFSGFWCGWDEANNKLNMGAYIFRKKPKGMYFSEGTSNDRARIAGLSELAFGHNYYKAAIEDKLALYKSTAKIFVARDKTKSGSILGFSLCYMLPKLSLMSFLHVSEQNASTDHKSIHGRVSDDMIESDKNGKIGIMQTICVSTQTRHRGVGRGLFEYTQQNLERFAPAMILAPAWTVGGKMSASRLLTSLGYSESIVIGDYWKTDCDRGAFDCPSRTSACNCKMTLFCRVM